MRLPPGLTNMKIYPKLVLTFLVVLLPLNLLGLYMNQSGSTTVKEEISASVQSKVHFYMSLIQSDILRTLKSEQEFIGDDDLQQLSVQGDVLDPNAKREGILRLERRLDLLLNSSAFVVAATITIPSLQKSITNTDYRYEMPEEYKALRFQSSRYQKPFVIWKGRVFLNVVYPERPFDEMDKEPLFVVTLEVSKPRIQEMLKQLTKENQGEALFIDNNLEWEVASQPGGALQKELPDAIRKILASDDSVQSVQTVRWKGTSYIVSVENSSLIGVSLVTMIPEQQLLGPLRKYRLLMWGIIILTVGIVLVFSYRLYRVIHRPLKKLISAFRKVEQGNLDVEVSHPSGDEFGYLYNQFNVMVQQVNKLIREVYEQKYRLQLSELKQLQSQINPHFLYNSFFSMYYMAKQHEEENLMKFVKYLGEYFQFITRDAEEEVPLSLEIKHAVNYIGIQSIRFQNRIEAFVDEVPEIAGSIRVPRLILQPIIENAYKHGLEKCEAGGLLKVRFHAEADRFMIDVENNGSILTDEELLVMQRKLRNRDPGAETTGLLNVHRRLQIKYGETGGLTIDKGDMGGWKVSIRIPFGEEGGHA
jgi:two-component system sensor histidine kinase YesM